MTASFKPFRPVDSKVSPAVSADTAGAPPSFKSQTFARPVNALVSGTVEGHGAPGFHVHPLIAGQLGLEEKELARVQAEIEKEIERRWIEAKEKSEVEGFTAGLAAGKKEAILAEKPRIEERLKRMDLLLAQIDQQTKLIFTANEDFLMGLLAQLLRAITLREIELDKEYTKRLVLHLIGQLSEKSDLVLTISDKDVQGMHALSQAIEHKFSTLRNLRLQQSPELSPGSCRLETKTVALDASVEEQIRNAMKVLSEARSEGKQ